MRGKLNCRHRRMTILIAVADTAPWLGWRSGGHACLSLCVTVPKCPAHQRHDIEVVWFWGTATDHGSGLLHCPFEFLICRITARSWFGRWCLRAVSVER